MKLLKLHIKDDFRSLHAGFEVHFHQLTDKGIEAMSKFQPFCFAGLNGSGKSNVLEALASIFYHLEFCVVKFRPKSFERYFRRYESKPDAYILEYLIGERDSDTYDLSYLVTIEKIKGEEPKMYIRPFPLDETVERKEISLAAFEAGDVAIGKVYLPDLIIGYSSGENETLSLPFIKSRLVNFDKYREDSNKGNLYDEPETSLIYIDEGMSQAVLLAALLFENDETLDPLKKEVGIKAMESFTLHLNNHFLKFNEKGSTQKPILEHIETDITKLKKCATCWYNHEVDTKGEHGQPHSVLSLDFYVNDATKTAFKKHFETSFELFRFFQVLYELNANIVPEAIKEEVYDSEGFYTKGKLPVASPQDSVFFFLNYMILKEKTRGKGDYIPLLLREFSDGEHQFLHTIGICLMLKKRRSILLLDEPETHFNPAWRARFIKILNDSITAGQPQDDDDFNIHLLKDVILTSHSPFIISDCMPDSVLFFKRDEENDLVEANTASELGLNTYGSSIDYLLKNFFKTNLIGKKSFEELKDVIENGSLEELRTAIDYFGESSEKQFIFRKIYEKTNPPDDNKT